MIDPLKVIKYNLQPPEPDVSQINYADNETQKEYVNTELRKVDIVDPPQDNECSLLDDWKLL